MQKIFLIIKIFINIILFCFYSMVSIFIGDFFYWYLLTAKWLPVPWADDPSHLQLAGFIILFVLFITILLRWFFYLRVFKQKK